MKSLALCLLAITSVIPARAESLVYEGTDGPGTGKHIVFIAGDHEYRSEESLPMLARIMAKHHGFKCTVLFDIDPKTGEIVAGTPSNIPGLEALKTADLAVVFLRFQDLPDEQMQHFDEYLKRGGPVVGMRTATHGFNIKAGKKYSKYSFRSNDKEYKLGFGHQVLGQTWVGHYGRNHQQSTRITIVKDKNSHPILRGVKDVWVQAGGYVGKPVTSEVLTMAQPLNGMKQDSPPSETQPPMPSEWTRSYKSESGKEARVFASQYGTSEDITNDGYRRLLINGMFWAIGMEDAIKPDGNIAMVGPFKPNTFGNQWHARGIKPEAYAGFESQIPAHNKIVKPQRKKRNQPKKKQPAKKATSNQPTAYRWPEIKDRTASKSDANIWVVDSQAEWKKNTEAQQGLQFRKGMARPKGKQATFTSTMKSFDSKRSATSIVVDQSPEWLNWEQIENIGPSNLGDAPVMLRVGPNNYWMFGRYGGRGGKKGEFQSEDATLEGFDMPLKTTRFPNQYNAPGGLKKGRGGYHAWQSRDMKTWVHHGPITESFGKWMTTAEFADGKAYFYYDFPNDQDPHVYVDADMFDGKPGDNKGMAYDDPSHGSDCAIIRDLDGKFHVIVEDWSPINAQTHAWDSPLAARAVSPDGVTNFKTAGAPVDERTKSTGKTATYKHPHWVKENPKRFKTNVAKYEVHEPEQNAYGDWAAISIGGQYYLFCDYDPKDTKQMSVGWFTSSSIEEPFEWCGNIGKGHPDPDIMFAEGRFYLATQQPMDFVSPGPWVEDVHVRVGVDTDNDKTIDKWTDWTQVKETYDYVKDFSKQVARTPASLDLASLPEGYGFQFEVKLKDTTKNRSTPVLDRVTVEFAR